MAGMLKKNNQRILQLRPEEILPNPAQPRVRFEERELLSLAESIKENGLLQPVTVRRNPDGNYELISGERRLRAVKLAGLSSIPAILSDTTGRQSAILALMENIQRKDLTFFEEAAALRSLITEWGLTQEEAAKKLGRSQSAVANKLRLLALSETEQKLILDNSLTERHARALLRIRDSDDRLKVLKYIIVHNMNVSQAEKYIDNRLQMPAFSQKRLVLVKDVRIFINTINKAVDVMKSAGINAQTEKRETESHIEYVVRIPTAGARSAGATAIAAPRFK